MATKPGGNDTPTYPEWATDTTGIALKTVTSSTHKLYGWGVTNGVGEVPNLNEVNYWRFSVYEWIQYLDLDAGERDTEIDEVNTRIDNLTSDQVKYNYSNESTGNVLNTTFDTFLGNDGSASSIITESAGVTTLNNVTDVGYTNENSAANPNVDDLALKTGPQTFSDWTSVTSNNYNSTTYPAGSNVWDVRNQATYVSSDTDDFEDRYKWSFARTGGLFQVCDYDKTKGVFGPARSVYVQGSFTSDVVWVNHRKSKYGVLGIGYTRIREQSDQSYFRMYLFWYNRKEDKVTFKSYASLGIRLFFLQSMCSSLITVPLEGYETDPTAVRHVVNVATISASGGNRTNAGFKPDSLYGGTTGGLRDMEFDNNLNFIRDMSSDYEDDYFGGAGCFQNSTELATVVYADRPEPGFADVYRISVSMYNAQDLEDPDGDGVIFPGDRNGGPKRMQIVVETGLYRADINDIDYQTRQVYNAIDTDVNINRPGSSLMRQSATTNGLYKTGITSVCVHKQAERRDSLLLIGLTPYCNPTFTTDPVSMVAKNFMAIKLSNGNVSTVRTANLVPNNTYPGPIDAYRGISSIQMESFTDDNNYTFTVGYHDQEGSTDSSANPKLVEKWMCNNGTIVTGFSSEVIKWEDLTSNQQDYNLGWDIGQYKVVHNSGEHTWNVNLGQRVYLDTQFYKPGYFCYVRSNQAFSYVTGAPGSNPGWAGTTRGGYVYAISGGTESTFPQTDYYSDFEVLKTDTEGTDVFAGDLPLIDYVPPEDQIEYGYILSKFFPKASYPSGITSAWQTISFKQYDAFVIGIENVQAALDDLYSELNVISGLEAFGGTTVSTVFDNHVLSLVTPRRYTNTGISLTSGVATTITHNLDQQIVQIAVYDESNDQKVDVDVTLVDENSLTITASSTITVSVVVLR